MPRAFKPTDTHLVLLSAAAQRDDLLLDLASRLEGADLQRTGEKLLAAGLVAETVAGPDQPTWRSDDNEQRIGLMLTPSGLAAIGVEAGASTEVDVVATGEGAETAVVAPRERSGTKRALVIDLLSREEGASVADLMSATGWLAHTTRAALTGLRKQGHVLIKASGPDGKTIYRIVVASTAVAGA
ncbi:DUF3489 domain-containing protein [Ancylobacter sp. Lp-2]|uniref:DUF3489 domain-containing protein n=1 Tax=Ancylobacter sp. Lp-2 TaxID=2881339 RepID=UPI001E5E12E3|nr:DUF3489 domain-containing protein [Ancylobacter sp. Lp-2]MCB4767675.1 DUF3489 domain-containing protein [Ancylobacter sp. Lp-2]